MSLDVLTGKPGRRLWITSLRRLFRLQLSLAQLWTCCGPNISIKHYPHWHGTSRPLLGAAATVGLRFFFTIYVTDFLMKQETVGFSLSSCTFCSSEVYAFHFPARVSHQEWVPLFSFRLLGNLHCMSMDLMKWLEVWVTGGSAKDSLSFMAHLFIKAIRDGGTKNKTTFLIYHVIFLWSCIFRQIFWLHLLMRIWHQSGALSHRKLCVEFHYACWHMSQHRVVTNGMNAPGGCGKTDLNMAASCRGCTANNRWSRSSCFLCIAS